MNLEQNSQRYRGIIIGTIILLLFISATMVANTYFAKRIKTNSFLINKVSTQKTLIQRINKALLRIRSQRNTRRSYELDLSELEYSFGQFNNTLYKFSKGGVLQDEIGTKVKIEKIADKQGIDILNRAIVLWADIQLAMEPLNNPSDPIPDAKLRAITDIVNAYGVQLMAIMDELIVYYKQQNNKETEYLYMSYGGTAALFVLLILFLLFKNRASVKDFEEAYSQYIEMPVENTSSEANILTRFLSDTVNNLQTVNVSVNQFIPEDEDSSLYEIYEALNTIRHDASMIGCNSIEAIADELLLETESLQNSIAPLDADSFEFFKEKLEQLNNNYNFFANAVNETELVQQEDEQPSTDDEQETEELEEKTEETEEAPSQYSEWLRLQKMATELAQKLDKKVEVHLHNLQTELPEHYHNGLIKISEQLLSNSVIHGIESPETRRMALKPEFGLITITLKPSQEGGYEFIYQDDGQGLNYDAIRSTVVEKGYATQETAAQLNKNQLAAYIFKLGFSTLKDTSIESNGGMGMDIVKSVIDDIGGKTIILNVVNKNTRFTVVLPPTASYDANEDNQLQNTA